MTDDFIQEFIEEAHELADSLVRALMEADAPRSGESVLQQCYRTLHTLKGNCMMFGFERPVGLFHILETHFDQLQQQNAPADRATVDLTLESLDFLRAEISGRRRLPKIYLF